MLPFLSGCIWKQIWYNTRTKHMASYSHSPIKVRTTASRGEHDGILFYILPPLLLGAVFAFCSMASSEKAAAPQEPAAEEIAAEE